MNTTVFRQIFDWFIELGYLEEEDMFEFYQDLNKMYLATPKFFNLLKEITDR